MFKRVLINLTDPICNCEEQSLSWGIADTSKGHSLVISCKACLTSLTIPPEKFVASFSLDKPYPGKPKPKPEPRPRDPADIIDISKYFTRPDA